MTSRREITVYQDSKDVPLLEGITVAHGTTTGWVSVDLGNNERLNLFLGQTQMTALGNMLAATVADWQATDARFRAERVADEVTA